ncbi:MAG: hypothetical protein OHK0011_14310 [Turneriella sp.]
MAFERLKRLLGGQKLPSRPGPAEADQKEANQSSNHETKAVTTARSRKGSTRRRLRSDRSPYSARPGLRREIVSALAREIRSHPQHYRTDKYTLLEIADMILEKKLGVPRPGILRAHHIFSMFTKREGRQRKNVTGSCTLWRGSAKGGAPVVTTVNAQALERLTVDARKYIVENPPRGRRRRLRTIPENICGNPLCVNPRHVRFVPSNPLSHQGQNHPRSKFTDKDIVRMVRDYNAGMTSREVGDKYGMHWTYVEQIMRKEKRTEATAGLKIRGRFGPR